MPACDIARAGTYADANAATSRDAMNFIHTLLSVTTLERVDLMLGALESDLGLSARRSKRPLA
jgi:hypothetical protein